ncbi:hypothetical protein HDU92_007385 [Lobulomyces angularis]|nr:hypothetical protein HDU92_007385 [Lobulomyces angularis]
MVTHSGTFGLSGLKKGRESLRFCIKCDDFDPVKTANTVSDINIAIDAFKNVKKLVDIRNFNQETLWSKYFSFFRNQLVHDPMNSIYKSEWNGQKQLRDFNYIELKKITVEKPITECI